jgi:glycosyltransferase involved in cell wall biosynthesis
MHIMEIVSGRGMNGAICHCRMLTEELIARGNKVTLVCCPGSQIAMQMASGPAEVVLSDLRRFPTAELRRIATLARQRQVDVIHTHMSRAHFFGVLLRWFSGLPCVATAHCRLIQVHWAFNDLVIAVSDATRRFHERYNFVRPGRIVTIHNFIDHRRMAGVPDAVRSKVRASFGVDESSFLIGVVGSIDPRKAQIYLIRAMPKILAAAPRTRLVLVGVDGPPRYVARAKSIATELGVAGAVAWAGHRNDVREIMAALDLYALSSLEESLPLSILEAMAAGLPIVSTSVGGIPECLSHGETGILVPPADSDALADAIIALGRDPGRRRQLGEAGRKTVQERFSPESQTTAIEAALRGVARQVRAA